MGNLLRIVMGPSEKSGSWWDLGKDHCGFEVGDHCPGVV